MRGRHELARRGPGGPTESVPLFRLAPRQPATRRRWAGLLIDVHDLVRAPVAHVHDTMRRKRLPPSLGQIRIQKADARQVVVRTGVASSRIGRARRHQVTVSATRILLIEYGPRNDHADCLHHHAHLACPSNKS